MINVNINQTILHMARDVHGRDARSMQEAGNCWRKRKEKKRKKVSGRQIKDVRIHVTVILLDDSFMSHSRRCRDVKDLEKNKTGIESEATVHRKCFRTE